MRTLKAFEADFPNEDACKALLAECRWPDGPVCPRCGNARVITLKAKPFHWVCKSGKITMDTEGKPVTCAKNGGYRFSVITHTIFQDTKIPLDIWFRVAYLMLTAKKGISALQIHRTVFGEDSGSDYRTSWFMCMRLRCAMRGGIDQLDARHRHRDVRDMGIAIFVHHLVRRVPILKCAHRRDGQIGRAHV